MFFFQNLKRLQLNSFKLFVTFLIIFSTGYSQWPPELVIPDSIVRIKDNSLNISQILGEYTYESNIIYSLEKDFGNNNVKQRASYIYENDDIQNSHKHYLELVGSYMRNKFPFTFSSVGFEWQPYGYLNSNKYDGKINSSLWIGPKIDLKFRSFPIKLNGGGLYHAENDVITDDPFSGKADDIEHDGGFYGGVEMGDYSIPLFKKIPLYATGKIEGIYTSQAKITKGNIGTAFIHELKIPGEFHVFLADTLAKGRKAQIIGGSDISDKTINSLNFMTGLKDLGDFIIRPSILYGLKTYGRHYPDYLDSIPDLEQYANRENRLLSGIRSNDSLKIKFSTWLDLQMENEDHLDRSTFRNSIISVNEDVDSFTISDTLLQNEKDFKRRFAQLFNSVDYTILDRVRLHYHNVFERDKTEYPEIYVYSNGDSTVHDNRDRVSFNHNMSVGLNVNPQITVEIIGDYKKNEDIHLNEEFSSGNKTTRNYLIDLILRYEKENGLHFNTVLGFANENEEYPDYVKKFYQAIDVSYSKFPKYRRDLYLKFNWSIPILNFILFEGFLIEKYYDNGYWDIGTWKSGYDSGKYLINDKNFETSFKLEGIFSPFNGHSYNLGLLIQNIYVLDGKNRVLSFDDGYLVDFRPFLGFRINFNERVAISGRAECYSEFKVHGSKGLISDGNTNFGEFNAMMEVLF